MANRVTVTLKEYTYYNGRQRRPGEEIQVDQATADRWERNGIAGSDVRTAEQALEDLTVAELKKKAKALDIRGYNDMDKATLIREIRAAQATPQPGAGSPTQTVSGDQTAPENQPATDNG